MKHYFLDFDFVDHPELITKLYLRNLAHLLSIGLLFIFVCTSKQSNVVRDYQNSTVYVWEYPKAQS